MMQALLPKPNRWPLLVVIALTVVLIGDAAVRGQRPAPRPPQPRVNPPNPGGRRNIIIAPVPNNQRRMEWITIYYCSRCNAELGRGPVPPPLAVCPNCGANFVANPMVAIARPTDDALAGHFAGPGRAFYVTLGAEGSLLAGMMLVGVVRLVVARAVLPVPAEEQPT
jgi:DNA-directed RNA polymerase subunit RPC12/RpoP